MGGGSSKNKKVVHVETPKPSYVAEEVFHTQPLVRSSPLPKIPSRQPSEREKSPSVHSRASAKRRSSNIMNALDRRSSGIFNALE